MALPNRQRGEGEVAFVLLICFAIVVIAAFCMFVMPVWSVWSREKAGQGELAQAESNRRIAVLEAQAKLDSAKHLANTEIERARGVAEANKIIGDSLKGNDAYLRYLWITELGRGGHETIYVPTEANLPILEAGRFGDRHPATIETTEGLKPVKK